MRSSNWQAQISVHVWISLAVLTATAAMSVIVSEPIRSIIPYAIAVGLVAWKHGVRSGVLFAGLATLVSVVVGAYPTYTQWEGYELEEVGVTYLKLTGVVVGAVLGKRMSPYGSL